MVGAVCGVDGEFDDPVGIRGLQVGFVRCLQDQMGWRGSGGGVELAREELEVDLVRWTVVLRSWYQILELAG